MFHSLNLVRPEEIASGEVRVFEGEGTPFLNIGKCKEVKSLRIGGAELPRKLNQLVPHPKAPERVISISSNMYVLRKDADGNTVVLRNIQSNDGIWQKGIRIFVAGVFEDAAMKAEPKAKPEPKAEAGK